MARKGWWRRFRDWQRAKRTRALLRSPRPLREFVYLDEVSLTSLLVSQKDTIPEAVTTGRSVSEQAELSAKASVDAVAAKAESATRYQTANSSSVESSRKAVVQTLFNELRDEETLPIALHDDVTAPDLLPLDTGPGEEGYRGWRGDDLLRGQLIELEVVLEVDPVFRISTMTSEFAAMAAEYPQMAGASGLAMLNEIEPVKKVLDRLLAGLIPIRARARNYSVATVNGQDYVVRSSESAGLGVPTRPLEVVGVTEHIGFWKDIRRVLFSSGRFKLLCRVARSGLHETWTPVKVAHLFGDIAPKLVEQIDGLGQTGPAGLAGRPAQQPQTTFVSALAAYAEAIIPPDAESSQIPRLTELIEIAARTSDESSPSAQRRAFADVRDLVTARNPGYEVEAKQDLAARRRARDHAGLSVMPNDTTVSTTVDAPHVEPSGPAEVITAKLIDVEIVAIYW